MAKSLQDRLQQKRSSTFVGRELQIELFRSNLGRSLDSEEYYFIFNIHGNGGVGKTTLVKKYDEIAKARNAVTAYTNEDVKNIPDLLADIAKQMKAQGAELKKFDKLYETYLKEKKRLEADPEAPKSTWAFGGKLLAKGSKAILRSAVPGSGLVLDAIDEGALGEQFGEWGAFVKKKLTNQDEVHLLLEPIEALTPIFLEGLNGHADLPKICFFFDTYEETDKYLDEWLRKMIEGKYGNAPDNLLIVISGREVLNPNDWSSFAGFLTTIGLEPFTDLEAKMFLERKKITDPSIVEVIINISGKIPVLMATLADEAPDSPNAVADVSDKAVERFLKWVKDPVQRKLALHAALPRQLDKDIVKQLLPAEADVDSLFDWLCRRPFVVKGKDHWAYHSVVRELMLKYLYQLSKEEWRQTHDICSAFYFERASDLLLETEEEQWASNKWVAYKLEWCFHRLCAYFHSEIKIAVRYFAKVFYELGNYRAMEWCEIVFQAGKICNENDWGLRIKQGMSHILAEEYDAALPLFQSINETDWLVDNSVSALFYHFEGYILSGVKKEKKNAIEKYEKAIGLNPNDASIYYNLGNSLYELHKLTEAIENYRKAIELDPEYAAAHYNLGIALYDQGKLGEAVAQYGRAIELDPEDALAYCNLGIALYDQGKLGEAVVQYGRAIELDPENAGAHNKLGNALKAQGKLVEAVAQYGRAIKLDPDYASAYYNLGKALYAQGKLSEAVEQFRKVIELFPDEPELWHSLGWTYLEMHELEKAQENLLKAWELSQYSMDTAPMNLGHICLLQGEKKKAMEWYVKSMSIFEGENEFFEMMESDYTDLKMADHGISQKDYEAILQELREL